ncbi:MAG: TerB N-terminal domain-containing protein [Armatimonadetes bacterium]|nr:TerB N-terminal domain-containing protein [Armatimonadota bacterium]
MSGQPGNLYWFPPGKPVYVGPHHYLPDGMVYVGTGLRAVSGRMAEPALIDPYLPLGRPVSRAVQIGYWPSYCGVDPNCRATYLNWLATGRCDRDVDIGYVFLFFYGLERRLLTELAPSNDPRSEWQYLLAELTRLLHIYTGSGSFQSYGRSLLDYAQTLNASANYVPPGPPRERQGYELPSSVRLTLGTFAAQGKPLPWEWAFAWYTCHPEVSLRTPAKRCDKEFRTLFGWRYVGQYGHGMLLKPNKTMLSVSHRPASASFMSREFVAKTTLPDVSVQRKPFAAIAELARKAETDLEPYSRWLGKNPEGRGRLEAVALLPDELAQQHRGAATKEIREWLERLVQDKPMAALKAEELFQWIAPARADKLTKKETVVLAQLLAKLGYGLEPDVRFGGPSLRAGDWATVFRLAADAPMAASEGYLAAALLADLFVAVAAADGSLGREEYDLLVRHLREQLVLPAREANRLNGHIWWLYHAKPSVKGLQKFFAAVSEDQKRALSAFLIQVVCVDGVVAPAEVAVLERVYGMLGLDQTQVHADIHQHMSGATAPPTEPVIVREGQPEIGVRIPAKAADSSEPAAPLDMALIQRKIAQTADIAKLLAGVFEEEEEGVPAAASDAVAGVCGLDGAHTALLQRLQEHHELGRAEFQELAAAHSLLPDGAIDALNEAALDLCDELVCETSEDDIQVNPDVLKEMLAAP